MNVTEILTLSPLNYQAQLVKLFTQVLGDLYRLEVRKLSMHSNNGSPN